jgi:hypothetical protein
MSYLTVSRIAADPYMRLRCGACAAVERIPEPENWAFRYSLVLAAQPGWSQAWESALAAGNPAPGSDAAVITDGMILAAVQAVRSQEGT